MVHSVIALLLACKTPTMLCGVYTRQLGCMQNLTGGRILVNIRLVSACTLDGYFQTYKNDVHFLPVSSMRKWRHCTFLHSGWRSPSLLRNMQFVLVSRLNSVSGVNTTVFEL